MFICVCNAIRERDVLEAVRHGAATAGQVYARLGVRPVCGRCAQDICRIVRPAVDVPMDAA